ncbi:histone methyltransferase set2 [Orbilia brochopaga]|uniref:Histone-lysine N-methyltransferase, H3 lysine-36 specific n=1 Tax=Orbilia brochopaga TaxID=3140254 RepID=A0AAV9V3Y7_9PEZI
MTSTEVDRPSQPALSAMTSVPDEQPEKARSPSPSPRDTIQDESIAEKKEASSSPPLSDPSPLEATASTNPSSPREVKPEALERSESPVKTDVANSQTAAKPARNGKAKKARHIILHNDLPDKTDEAQSKFQLMEQCTYTPKSLADSGQEEELMSCDCRPEFVDGANHACSHGCINAETFVECVDGDSNCGGQCRNQKFQNKEYANVSVIQTEKKGYGLRANTPMEPGTFIYEYIGEVINESQFRKRREQYGKEDIKHFYFMSIKVGEYIDATKRGCLARFCNHSCNPNCMVEKWVVGGKLRMGIFAKVKIEAGEELTFDYNVDRYGADPQKCFCGEPNCIGYIGGKTQTEASTKLPTLYLEALGLDDDDGWQTATAKKTKKKKDDDFDYVTTVKARQLSHEGVPKVMGTLMQASKRWIVVKLLDRIEASPDPKVLPRVLEMHGYKIFNRLLGEWKKESDVLIPILNIMQKWPRITKNKISSSKIESTVKDIAENSEDAQAKELATELTEAWSTLEMGYRIPRRQKDTNDSPNPDFERRNRRRSRSRSRSPDQKEPVNIPTGPRLSKPAYIPKPRTYPKDAPKGPRQPNLPLPPGWKVYKNPNGKSYYYNTTTKVTQWDHPGQATPPTPQAAPRKIVSQQNEEIAQILKSIEQQRQEEIALAAAKKKLTPIEPEETEEEKAKKALHHERKVKLAYYTIVKESTAAYVSKMGKPEVKKRNEEITRLCAQKDIKKMGMKTPTQVDSEKHRQIRKFADSYMRSLWKKMKVYYAQKKKNAGNENSGSQENGDPSPLAEDASAEIGVDAAELDGGLEVEPKTDLDAPLPTKEDDYASADPSPNTGSLSPKRKRSDDEEENADSRGGSPKRSRINETLVLSTIPPPPPESPPGSPSSESPIPPEPASPKRKRDDDEASLSATPGDVFEETHERPLKRPRSISQTRSPSPRPMPNPAVQTTA